MADDLPLVCGMGEKEMSAFLWGLGAVIFLCCAAGCAAVLYICRGRRASQEEIDAAMTRHPQICEEMLAAERFLAEHGTQDLFVESYDGKRLHAQLLRKEDAKGTVLAFHGYRSNWNIDFSLSVPFYYAQGYNVLLVDQRAHQKSAGHFLTFGARERYDVLSWVTYLGQMLGSEHPMYLSGLSMGATTVMLASCFEFPANVRGIFADCGFTSAYEEMRHVLKNQNRHIPAGFVLFWIGIFTRLLAGFGLREADTRDAVAESRYPILFIHGTGDDFVPCEMTKENYAACTAEKECILVEDAPHGYSYVYNRPRVQSALENFMDKHLPKEKVS